MQAIRIGLFLFALSIAAAGADATGKWTGEVKSPSGEFLSPAYLLLQQQGSKVEGSGGPNPGELYPIQKGEITESGALRFEMTAGGALMKFELLIDGDQIKGQMTREKDGQTLPASFSVKREKSDLKATVTALDKELFAAYNACDLVKFASFFADENVEFYHDKGGLSTAKKQIVEATQKNICGKVRRELVEGSLEVYPVPGYGAIEAGSHRFYNRSSGKEEGGGVAKFLNIWQQGKDGQWKLTRVVSYAH